MQKTKSNSVKMGSRRVKGLLKGLRCISQIFDEEKEAEMKIGMPTDVKHVAHIGWDGPSADAPTWMKSFESSGEGNNQEVQKAPNSSARDQPDVPKSTRRVSSKDNPSSSPKKGKSRHSKHHSKDSKKDSKRDSKNTKSNQDGNVMESDSTAGEHSKKSRRKKSKDSGSSRSSKSRGSSSGSGSDFPDQEIAPNM